MCGNHIAFIMWWPLDMINSSSDKQYIRKTVDKENWRSKKNSRSDEEADWSKSSSDEKHMSVQINSRSDESSSYEY